MKFKFRTLVNRHHRLVYGIALRILGNVAEAEDAAQEVYERAWKHIERIDEAEAQAWLSRVTRNLCIDKLRARKPVMSLEESVEHAESIRCDKTDPIQTFESAQLSDWLKAAISRLKEPHKTLVILLELQQKTVKEVAAITELSENQVKVYSHRARKQLKHLLQGAEI